MFTNDNQTFELLFTTGLLKTDLQNAAWDFYHSNSYSIEILKDDVLQKVYFRVKDKVLL